MMQNISPFLTMQSLTNDDHSHLHTQQKHTFKTTTFTLDILPSITTMKTPSLFKQRFLSRGSTPSRKARKLATFSQPFGENVTSLHKCALTTGVHFGGGACGVCLLRAGERFFKGVQRADLPPER